MVVRSSFFRRILWKLWRCQRESVRAVCVFLSDGRSVDAKSMRCTPEMFFFSQKRCYGDKYLVSILPSNNDVTQSCCEKAVIFTVPLYHLARHHHWIRPLLSKRNFKAGVLTAREKTIFLMLVCLAFQNVRFLPVPKYFLRNSAALPCLTQVPYKTLGNEEVRLPEVNQGLFSQSRPMVSWKLRWTFSVTCNSFYFTFLAYVFRLVHRLLRTSLCPMWPVSVTE